MVKAVLKVDWPIEKHWESVLRRFAQQKKSVTVRAGLQSAGCNAPDCSVSHYIAPLLKNPLSCDVAFHHSSLTTYSS